MRELRDTSWFFRLCFLHGAIPMAETIPSAGAGFGLQVSIPDLGLIYRPSFLFLGLTRRRLLVQVRLSSHLRRILETISFI